MSNLDQQGHDVLVQGRKGLAEGHQARQGGHEEGVTLGLGQNCHKEKPMSVKSNQELLFTFTTAITQNCIQHREIMQGFWGCWGGTCEQGPHHIDGQTSHTQGFGQGILDAQVGEQLDGKDLSKETKAMELRDALQLLSKALHHTQHLP